MANFDKEESGPFYYIPLPGGGMIEIAPARILDVTRGKDGNWIVHTVMGVKHHPPGKEKGNG